MLSDLTFTDEQLRLAWKSVVLADSDSPTCDEFASHLYKRVGNPHFGDAAHWLMAACAWRLHDSTEMPLVPAVRTNTAAILHPGNVPEAQLAAVKRFLTEDLDPELLARLGDLLWIRKRDHVAARLAAHAYYESADRLMRGNHIRGIENRLNRAIAVSSHVQGRSPEHESLISRIESAAEREAAHNTNLKACLTVLASCRSARFQRLYELSQKRAQEIPASTPLWAQTFWRLAAKFAVKCGNQDAARDAVVHSAQIYEAQAKNSPDAAVAAHFWEQAVVEYREAPNTSQERELAHKELLAVQKGIRGQMIAPPSIPIECPELISISMARLDGKDKPEALVEFVFGPELPKLQGLKDAVLKLFATSPLYGLFELDRFGSTWIKAASAGGASDGGPIPESRMLAEMCQQLSYHRMIMVTGVIEPMRARLVDDHTVDRQDFADFVLQSPLALPDRYPLIVTGLWSGMYGDWMQSLHILVPQLEHALRMYLAQAGVITSTLSADGTQKEINLNDILIRSDIEQLLGPEFAFCLRATFIEKHGLNVRNELCHGMLSASWFTTDAAAYAWWLIVRFFCFHHAASLRYGSSAV